MPLASVIEGMIFDVVMRILGKLSENPEFKAKAEAVHAEKQAAQTLEDHLNAAQKIHDLLNS